MCISRRTHVDNSCIGIWSWLLHCYIKQHNIGSILARLLSQPLHAHIMMSAVKMSFGAGARRLSSALSPSLLPPPRPAAVPAFNLGLPHRQVSTDTEGDVPTTKPGAERFRFCLRSGYPWLVHVFVSAGCKVFFRCLPTTAEERKLEYDCILTPKPGEEGQPA